MFAAVRQMVIAGALIWAAASQAQAMPFNASVYLNAQRGSTMGYELAAPVTWRHGVDGRFSSSNYSNNYSSAGDGVSVFYEDAGLPWLFQFAAPGAGEALRVGRYENPGAGWGGDPAGPGMLISSPFGNMVQWSGWFNVLEIGYADNGSLDHFAVDFRQFDGHGLSGPSVFGSLRYNSRLALKSPAAEVPEPGSLALLLAAMVLLGGLTRRRASAPI